MPRCRANRDSGPKATARTLECSPSAPITRSKLRGAARSKVTSTASGAWVILVTESPNRYSASLRAASYKMPARSPRTISTSAGSTTPKAAFMLARCFPVALTYVIPRVRVRACRSAPRIPARLATPIAAPRMSTAWPPSRGAGARSTTVGQKPCLDSQYASVRPAGPAPEISTFPRCARDSPGGRPAAGAGWGHGNLRVFCRLCGLRCRSGSCRGHACLLQLLDAKASGPRAGLPRTVLVFWVLARGSRVVHAGTGGFLG